MMIYRRFVVISWCSILFFAQFALGDSLDVIHAYRQPSEADLQWLFGDAAAPIPSTVSPSGVVQAGYLSHRPIVLVPHSDPCKPAQLPKPQLPKPSIPPAPVAANNRMNTGLAQDEEGVANIASTVVDSSNAVVQMAGNRLPPPTELPDDTDIAVLPAISPAADITVARLPVLKEKDHFPVPPIVPDTAPGCGSHHKTCPIRNSRNVPCMTGSSVWFTGYSVGTGGTTPTEFTLPTMLLSRPNAAEHFNASAQNRIWADYRSWHNAATMDAPSINRDSRSVEQFSFGLEKQILRSNSVELRVPVIYQFESNWFNDSAASLELGNISVFLKQVLLRNSWWTISGGGGTSLPTAEDWRPLANARLKNNAYNLVAFLGVQWHPNRNTFGHFVLQADTPIEKNELSFGGNSVTVEGQQVIRTGIQLGRWIYRSDHSKRPCRFGVFAEVNYAVVTAGSAFHHLSDDVNSVYVDEMNARKSTLTAAMGVPMVFGKLTCTNSLILPISGNDRPFSVGYNVSLSRQF